MGVGYNDIAGNTKQKEETTAIQSKVTEDSYLKPTFGQRLKRVLMPNDPRAVVDNYFWNRWLPGVRDAVCNVLIDVVDGFFSDMTDGRVGRGGRRRYDRSSLDDSRVGQSTKKTKAMNWREWDHIPPLANKFDAESVLIDIRHHLEKFNGNMSIREWFEFHNIDADFTNCRYGWRGVDPDDVQLVAYGGGWKIDMPRPEVM